MIMNYNFKMPTIFRWIQNAKIVASCFTVVLALLMIRLIIGGTFVVIGSEHVELKELLTWGKVFDLSGIALIDTFILMPLYNTLTAQTAFYQLKKWTNANTPIIILLSALICSYIRCSTLLSFTLCFVSNAFLAYIYFIKADANRKPFAVVSISYFITVALFYLASR
jgi:hypothetical protein